MNIFNKVALQGLKKNRTRTLVTILGVALSAALITGVATFGVSLLQYLAAGAAVKYGGWHVAFLDVDPAFAQQCAADPEVAAAAVTENVGYAVLDGCKTPEKPYLCVTGFSPESFASLPVTLLTGRLPENSSEAVLSGRVATRGGVRFSVGDTVTLSVGTRQKDGRLLGQNDPFDAAETFTPQGEKTYTVVGLCQTPGFEADDAPGYTLITAQDETVSSASLSLFITLKKPRTVQRYAAAAADGRACLYNNAVLRFMGLSRDADDQMLHTLLLSVGAVVIVIIMVGSVFLIYNSFNISLNERTHQFGILSSVGATPAQLRRSVLFEGVCIGAVGIPAGILLGLGSIRLVMGLVARNFADVLYTNVPLTMVVSLPVLAGAAAVSLVTILISADIPARRAAAMPVMECIRQTNEIKVEAGAVKASPLVQRLFGLEGSLALKNFRRNKKRYRSIVLSLILSVVLFISTSAFVTEAKSVSAGAYTFTTYDIALSTPGMDDAETQALLARLKDTDGVRESSCQAYVSCGCTVDAALLSDAGKQALADTMPNGTAQLSAALQFLDDDTYTGILRQLGLPEADYTSAQGKLIAVAKLHGTDDHVQNVEDCEDLFSGSSAALALVPQTADAAENVTVTFVNTVPPDTLPILHGIGSDVYSLTVMAPYSRKAEMTVPEAAVLARGLTFSADNAAQATDAIEARLEAESITAEYSLYNMYKMLDDNRNFIFIANVFAYTFITMISLIAVANVFNTISTNIRLRRRELAMLRSVGMSDRSFNRMMRFECAFYGTKALAFGLPLAVACAWLVHKTMLISSEAGPFTLPWASIGISIFSVLLVIFVTMMYAVRSIKKENILDALRDDMA